MRQFVTNLDHSLVVGSCEEPTWYREGELLANSCRYPEALLCFDHVLCTYPNHVSALIFRGVVLLHLDRCLEALDSFETVLATQPQNAEALMFQGVALHRLGRYRRAYASYDKALGRRPGTLFRKVTRAAKQFWNQVFL